MTMQVVFYIDIEQPGGQNAALYRLTNNAPPQRIALMARNILPVTLEFRTKSTTANESTAAEIPEGWEIVMAGRATADGDLLFLVDDLTAPEGDATGWTGTLDLDTEGIAAALAGKNSLEISIDVMVRKADDSERVTYRIPAIIYRQMYAGDGEPSSIAAVPPVLVAPNGDRWSVSVTNEGQLELMRLT